MTIGGRDGNPKQIDGTHITNTESTYDTPDPNAQGLAIFDMTDLTWSTQYSAGAPAYEQSNAVKQFYSEAQQYVTSCLLSAAAFSYSTAEPTVKTLQAALQHCYKSLILRAVRTHGG